jgi:hypothetical protein
VGILKDVLEGGDAAVSFSTSGPESEESVWLELGNFELRSGRLRIVDPTWSDPVHEGLSLELKPGTYLIEAKVMKFGQERRISRVRLFLKDSSPIIGDAVGEASADVAHIAFFDSEEVDRFLNDNSERSERAEDIIPDAYWLADDQQGECGVALLDATADLKMPYVWTGFGDGSYPAYELKSGSDMVGVEIEFIKPGTPYPRND